MIADEYEGMRRMWASVLASCTEDALKDQVSRLSGGKGYSYQNSAPASWVGSKCFRDVCHLAGHEGGDLQKRVLEKMSDLNDCKKLLDEVRKWHYSRSTNALT